MDDLISKKKVLEKLQYRKPEFGEDGSKDRYRYMQWMADIEAVKEVPSEIVRCEDCKWRS